MEIVIKISEADYWVALEQLKEYSDKILDTPINKEIPNTLSNRLLVALFEGTVLPKGHGRLIEDNFEVGPVFDDEGCRISYKYVTQEDLNNAPTIIPADKENKETGKKNIVGVRC